MITDKEKKELAERWIVKAAYGMNIGPSTAYQPPPGSKQKIRTVNCFQPSIYHTKVMMTTLLISITQKGSTGRASVPSIHFAGIRILTPTIPETRL